MKRGALCLFFAVGLVLGCGNSDKPQPYLVSLAIVPAELSVTVVNGEPVTQDYQVFVTDSEGKTDEVTDLVILKLADERYGAFTGAKLAISGLGAGPTKVQTSLETVSAEAALTVYVKKQLVDGDLPMTTPNDFDNATEDPQLVPTIRYPLDRILVPPNIGKFDVHWQSTASVFELRMRNTYVDVRRYTKGLPEPATPRPFWAAFELAEWSPIASSKEQLTLEVAAMDPQQPGKKGTSTRQVVDVTNENTRGGIYYWASNPGAVLRYDVGKPSVPPARMFASGQVPGNGNNCHGCHTLSKDGTKLAMTLDGGNGPGVAVNVADRVTAIGTGANLRWNFATFSPDNQKLLTVYSGAMVLRSTAGGGALLTLPNSSGKFATHPELSPDGTKLVNAECAGGYEAVASQCGLVIRSIDLATNTAGAIEPLVPYVAGQESYYPSFSPDGQWIAFTRSAGGTYDIASAETWLVRADGSAAPIKLAAADLDQANRTNSWARWVPFAQTFGPANETMFYLTFSSKRPFGVRIPAGGVPQIWMTPIFPSRALANKDPSGPAFRLPFQDVATGNHIAQWTQAIVE